MAHAPVLLLVLAILLPGCAEPRLEPAELDAIFGSSVPKIVIVGDSISRGYGADPGFLPRHTFTFYLFTRGLFVTTLAHNLDQVQHLPQYANAVTKMNTFDPWSATLVMLGVNDFNSDIPLEVVRSGYRHFIQKVTSHHTYQIEEARQRQTLICVTPLPTGLEKRRNRPGYTMEELRSMIAQECTRHGVPVIDGKRLLPPNLEIPAFRPSGYFSDGLHLNALGHREVGKRLWRELLQIFDRPWPSTSGPSPSNETGGEKSKT